MKDGYELWQSEWRGISLVEIAEKYGFDLNAIATNDIYAEYYKRQRENNYDFEDFEIYERSKINEANWLVFLPGRKDRKLPGLPVHEMPDIMTIKRKRKKRSLNGNCVGAQKSGTLHQKLWLLYMITGWMAIPRREFSM